MDSFKDRLSQRARDTSRPALAHQSLGRPLTAAETALAEGAESAVMEGLREAAAGAQAPETPPEIGRIEEFLGRFPGWAELLAARQERVGALEHALVGLSERMAQDPFLSAAMHEVLSAVTSVRSTAAILAESEDMEPEWRARFHANIHEDSIRLSEAAQALVAYIDSTEESETGLSSPQEEVESWLARTDYHLAALERPQPPAPARPNRCQLFGPASNTKLPPKMATSAAAVAKAFPPMAWIGLA